MGFDSMQTKDIGLGSRASLSSVGGLVASSTTGANNALQDGSLILNGVSVGASLTVSDNLSSTDNNASAIAKAAAINAVSAQSGVFATVGTTEVAGTNGMSATANQTAVLDINGVTTSTIQLTGNNEIDRTSIAAAINEISSQTGVTATNSHDDNQGISLNAADGRNIDLESGNGSAITNLGLAAAGVYVGTYELNTKDGSSISVSSTVAHAEDGQQTSGLSFGSYQPNIAQMVSTTRATDAGTATPSSSTAGQLLGNTLMINGVGVQAANGNDDTASSGTTAQKASSAIAIAAAINKSSAQTGVTATAQANVIAGTGFTAGAVTAVTLNGVSITTNLGSNSTRDDVLSELNAFSGQTGVVASANGSGISLTATDGRNITIEVDGAGGAAALGLDGTSVSSTATTYYGKVSMSSNQAFTLTSGSEGPNSNFTALGLAQGTYGGADNGVKVSQIDISTQQGATDAIKAVDAAIDTVSANQAMAGAFQNRLNYIVNNLTSENTNITSARSNITDADYGTATTNMAKAQIVSQAATAMLAQANQSQQTVLSLLK
jgi:flagellin